MSVIAKLRQIWKITELRNSIFFVLGLLVIFRIAAHIPVPGINNEALQQFFSSNQLLGLVNIFSGGGLENFSIVAMGVAPYITASIIFQLLTMIVPKLEEISKDGEAGRQKINQWTRYLTIPLAFLQGYGLVALLRQSQGGIISDLSIWKLMVTLITVTAGTIFLMWIGEIISEKNIGNGISIMIFVGIVASLPQALQQTLLTYTTSDPGVLLDIVIFALIALVTIVGVVIITEGQRNIPISYARQVRGSSSYGSVNTHLPLRVNQAGVIPIIFAISFVLFPPVVAQFFANARTAWVADAANFVADIFQNQLFYGILYFLLVFGFTYFYTEVIFKPDQIAENLQKQGAFIPGIRPGKPTEEYLNYVSNRIVLFGALFLGAIAVLPLAVQQFTGIGSLTIGGTSLLIVVSVVIEIVDKVKSQLTMRDYEAY
ncbi:MAG: preprotein translocase subunit SecY [Candidatus Buchananbacteria bacterium CG10_big_fil_rev_8_21_14_0_10_42_9]|uniref:Protein translocase subunit SecY n=1 Tax=Candidatus Buchananbacteria bacterium CG10_big_fil_rev_8_21_14_0_10_42_9 TaxID=1974526 RepID=A0A2H0W4D2_9BACT|nr:MAG: preprotein translocase subunit SecY [Candidatus Buchananbacteria bacterium CG10_big_fil_rev_8_21_14_0_10_42_9]